MSYFGKFYLVGPEATKAADWLFSADVSKAPGTGSAPRFAGEISPQNSPGEPRLAFPFQAASAEGVGSVWKRLLSLSSPQSGFCHIYTGALSSGMEQGCFPLAPAVPHIWSCDGCWSKPSTTLASCGLLSPFPRLGSSLWHSQGCKSSSSHRKGNKSIVPFPLLVLAPPGSGRRMI